MTSTHPLGTLRQFVRRRERVERCEFCGAGLGREHRHLFELATQSDLACVCDALRDCCSTRKRPNKSTPMCRAASYGAFGRHFQPERRSMGIIADSDRSRIFHAEQCRGQNPMATYPSPAGPTGSTLRRWTPWERIANENPVLRELEPDVEALLVNRTVCAGRAAFTIWRPN